MEVVVCTWISVDDLKNDRIGKMHWIELNWVAAAIDIISETYERKNGKLKKCHLFISMNQNNLLTDKTH